MVGLQKRRGYSAQRTPLRGVCGTATTAGVAQQQQLVCTCHNSWCVPATTGGVYLHSFSILLLPTTPLLCYCSLPLPSNAIALYHSPPMPLLPTTPLLCYCSLPLPSNAIASYHSPPMPLLPTTPLLCYCFLNPATPFPISVLYLFPRITNTKYAQSRSHHVS